MPNIFAAAIIGVVGWLIAKVLGGLAMNVLAATGVDRLTQRFEAAGGVQLSRLGGTLVFILVLVPTLIAALDALKIESISGPARDMLRLFLEAVPNILAAAAILAIAWFVGRFVADLLTRLLANLEFDRPPRDSASSGPLTRARRQRRLAGPISSPYLPSWQVGLHCSSSCCSPQSKLPTGLVFPVSANLSKPSSPLARMSCSARSF